MCGIVAGIYENIYTVLLDGLIQLQNRGYDSAGIAVLNNCINMNNNIHLIKKASTKEISAIEYLKKNNIDGSIGIGHTRWATHGGKTDKNSHPHMSNCNRFCVVHNGIIENYEELKEMLIEKGYIMQSETDTEVIANLLSYYFSIQSVEESIHKLINVLQGTWGLVIISIDEPNTIYATRFGSPLLIGYDDKNVLITSEQSGFCNKMNNYFCEKLPKPIGFVIFFTLLFSFKGDYLNAEYLFEELEIDTSTKTEDDSSALPTNPFELVEMIRRQNSMNDATDPSDAIDDALRSFNSLEEN